MVPDLFGYNTSHPGAQEWLLSDHPRAVTDRARQRAAAVGIGDGPVSEPEQYVEPSALISSDVRRGTPHGQPRLPWVRK